MMTDKAMMKKEVHIKNNRFRPDSGLVAIG